MHTLAVIPPYFDALVSGTKTFEVRENDRAYQRGDVLRLREWHPERTSAARSCSQPGCEFWELGFGHWASAHEFVEREVTFVYSGDSRFGGIEPGYVVLGIKPVTS